MIGLSDGCACCALRSGLPHVTTASRHRFGYGCSTNAACVPPGGGREPHDSGPAGDPAKYRDETAAGARPAVGQLPSFASEAGASSRCLHLRMFASLPTTCSTAASSWDISEADAGLLPCPAHGNVLYEGDAFVKWVLSAKSRVSGMCFGGSWVKVRRLLEQGFADAGCRRLTRRRTLVTVRAPVEVVGGERRSSLASSVGEDQVS